MRKALLIIFVLILSVGGSWAVKYESLDLLNTINLASYYNDYLGFVYDTHGCLHFTPPDIYLLVRTLPKGIPLRVKKYKEKTAPFSVKDVPYLTDITKNTEEIEKHAQTFQNGTTEVVVYPGLNKLFIKVDGYPYAQVKALAGPEEKALMAYEVYGGEPIVWDFMLSTPTDPGKYSVLRSTSHYLSNAYYKNTIVPFGAWMIRRDGNWVYQKGNQWFKLPKHLVNDLALPEDKRQYNYFDVTLDKDGQVFAARWASHDFGKYVLQWTKDGRNFYPEMGYAVGELAYEQIMLVKDFVHILTMPGPDDFDYLMAQNKNFVFYKQLYDFVISDGKTVPAQVNPAALSYYKLFNRLELTDDDWMNVDPRVMKAYYEYGTNRLPRSRNPRRKALGLYYYLRFNSLVIDKQAYWYGKLRQDWDFWRRVRVSLREDFEKMGILSLENRQNVLESWLSDRLEFRAALPPQQAKYVQELSFSEFFNPDDENRIFAARESEIMRQMIQRALRGEIEGPQFHSVKALNDYNFGLLLNDILGDLYKSHGCLHVSPRNAYFLFYLLPKGAQVVVYDYSEKIAEEQIADIPYLANMVNIAEDLELLKENFKDAKDIQVALYPSSGVWVIFIKGEPFAKLRVKGGPKETFYLMQDRDKDGKPIFEDHLAYPTTPGTYYIFKKTENYVSNIYYPTTIIPMGATIRYENNKWVFNTQKGKLKRLPAPVLKDLLAPPEDKRYKYYDAMVNASGEVEALKWGSHPFGRYALQTTRDFKNPHPELIHSSGDLMMEERQLIDDLINILSAPYDDLDECITGSEIFEVYKACYDFVQDPTREDIIEAKEAGSYKLYYGMPISTEEAAEIPRDAIIASKVLKNEKLTKEEKQLLVKEGIAYYRGGQFKINMQKIRGLNFDTYQFVVTIEKYAHHYGALKKYWPELTGLRKALLTDFNEFVIKDPQLLHNFMRELMIRRTELKGLTQRQALEILSGMLE
ncbi:hypothetical protein ACFL5U_00990 [Candidatus Margulisiibacteriota bacterium]